MKILKIHFKNLNSLKGEHFLDFTKKPLNNAGVFVITGHTGAGKSTILDAITLALYGRVPRYESTTAKEIISQGTMDCWAEVEFETKEGRYRSKWALGKRKTGTFKSPIREIANLLEAEGQPAEILAAKSKDCDKLIIKLLKGLDFKRFTRSVLLAQGDFVDFLKGAEDRSVILERITDSSRYSTISTAAYNRHKLALDKLKIEKEKTAVIQLLTEEEKEQLALDLAGNKSQEKIIKKDKELCQAKLDAIYQIERRRAEATQWKEELAALLEQKELKKADFALLEQHEKVAPFEADYRALELLKKEQKELKEDLERLAFAKIKLVAQKQDLEKNWKAQESICEQKSKDLEAFGELKTKVLALEEAIKTKDKLIKELDRDLEDLYRKQKNKKRIISKLEADILDLNQKIKEGKEWLLAKERYKDLEERGTIAELKSKYQYLLQSQKEQKEREEKEQKIKKKIKDLEEKLNQKIKEKENHQKYLAAATLKKEELCKSYELNPQKEQKKLLAEAEKKYSQKEEILTSLSLLDSLSKEKQTIQDELINLEEAIEGNNTVLAQIDTTFLQQENVLSHTKEQKKYYENVLLEQQKKSSLEDYRGSLKEGEECPLCFSKEQPFRAAKVTVKFALKQAEKDVKKVKQILETVETDFYKIITEKKQIHANILQLMTQKEKETQKLYAVEENIKNCRDRGGEEIASILEQKQKIGALIETTQKEKIAYKKLLASLQELFTNTNNSHRDIKNLATNLEEIKEFISLEAKELEELGKKRLSLADLLAGQQITLEKGLAKYNLEGDYKKIIAELEQIQKELERQRSQQKERQTGRKLLELELKNEREQNQNLQAELLKKTTEKENLEAAKNDLHQKSLALFGGENIRDYQTELEAKLAAENTQKEKLKKNLERQKVQIATLSGQEEEKENSSQKMLQTVAKKEPLLLFQLQQKGIVSFEDLKNNLLIKELAEQWQKEKKELDLQLNLKRDRLKNNAEAAAKITLLAGLDQKENLELEKQNFQKDLEELQQKIGALQEQLNRQEQEQAKHSSLLANIKQLQKEEERWGRLNKLIGSANGKKFRLFAQSITLRSLIRLANKHLKRFLDGRYYLEKKHFDENQKTLEIDIVDTFQANNKRPLKTLSGGESFLASLALALGLSDMASGAASIESLFIDEGFGSLDSDTLVVAIRALKALEATGKTIGVISHVEQLKNSIDTQVHVTKKGGGFSTISIIA